MMGESLDGAVVNWREREVSLVMMEKDGLASVVYRMGDDKRPTRRNKVR
jgi:hypothetical protein